MKRVTWAYLAVGGLVAVGALAWAFAPRPIEVETERAVRGRFESTIDEDAKTRLRDRYVVSAPLAGRVARVALREGDPVRAGDEVASLTPVLTPMVDERTRREQQARLDGALANVQRVAARIEAAEAAVERARHDTARTEELARQGFASAAKLEADRLAEAAARRDAQVVREERHVARHDVEQARAALDVSAGSAGSARSFALRSPVEGRVLKVVQASEAVVALGTPLLELGDTARMEVVAELLTTDALKAAPGSRVLIERWGGPTVLQGRVRRVEPAAFTKVSALGVEEQRVNVLIDITSPPAEWQALGDGYRVSVRIVTQSADQAVLVPVGAVFPRPEGEGMAVFRLEGDRARLVPVRLGGRNGVQAWVTEGVDEGAELIVYPPATLADGARVKPRKV
ncbi:MAG: efflux RND transporter periplasmic adaptor subunit [Rhizobacter sp.]